ncbi:MAG: hypothetical protein EBQ73_14080, partial [Gammaproteobacteria bacterium]|nr:hypothetical protein [Gammaproteobacteria bacterium]
NVVNLKWKGFDTLMSLLDDHNAAVRLRAAAEIFKLWGNRLPALCWTRCGARVMKINKPQQ